MRRFFFWISVLALVVLATNCTTVDPSECFPNTSGGFGGSTELPIAAGVGATTGGFGAPPPRRPLDYGDPPNPCIVPPTPCVGKCLDAYEGAAGQCGLIGSEAQRKACQDAAYASYHSCDAACQESDAKSKRCTDKFVNCQNKGPTFCLKVSEGKSVCRQCRDRCNAGDPPSPTCVKCLF